MKITDGVTIINFSPEAGYIKPDDFDVIRHSAISGKEYSYKFSKKRRWEIPLENIATADATTFNDWRDDLAQLTFYDDMINAPSVSYTVRIHNDEKPLSSFGVPNWEDKFRGTLILREL